MFVSELFEGDNRQVLVVYPGRFQPFHKGHAAVYNHLCEKYGAGNVYIVTSDKVEPPRSPFSFDDKKKMMELTGVDPSHIVFDAQPYRAMSLVDKFDAANTTLLFAISEKDMAEDPRFQFKPKKDGSPSYFQPLTSLANTEPLTSHAYITTVPTFNFTVLGQPANSATQIRAQFASAEEATQKKIVTDLFGKFSPAVYKIMKTKLSGMNEGIDDLRGGYTTIDVDGEEILTPKGEERQRQYRAQQQKNAENAKMAKNGHWEKRSQIVPHGETTWSVFVPNKTVDEGHDIPGEKAAAARKRHFDTLPKETQDAMRSRLGQGRGYWDSYYKAVKQGKKVVKEDPEIDYQIQKIQQKYDVPRQEALELYHVEGVRVEEPKKPKQVSEEVIHTTNFKNFEIKVDSHYLERARQRKVGHSEVGRTIEKFPRIEQELQEVDPGQQFWAYDTKQNIGLGMRKFSDKNGSLQLLLKTVIRGEPPEQGRTPVITIA